MTTLTIKTIGTVCQGVAKEHTPNISAISMVGDEQFTFCEMCEQNIERWYDDSDDERLPLWRDWKVSK